MKIPRFRIFLNCLLVYALGVQSLFLPVWGSTTDLNQFTTGETLALSEFLSQVAKSHEGYRASVSVFRSAGSRVEESQLLTRPSLISSLSHTVDEKPQVQPAFLGTRTTSDVYSIGIQSQTTFGLTGKLTYNFNHTVIDGVNSALVPNNSFYVGSPKLELTQSLWRNSFGSEIAAQVNLVEASALALSFREKASARALLAEAQVNYWRVVIAQRVVNAQKDFLSRAQKMFDWNSRRVRLSLGDRADLLQSQSLLEIRKLEFKAAEDDLKNSSRSFNSLRGVSNDSVPERLVDLHVPDLKISRTDLLEPRDDVKAAEQNARLTRATSLLSVEKNLPTLEIFGSYALNSFETNGSNAYQQSWSTRNPTSTIGIRLVTPLDFATASRTVDAHRSESLAAEMSYRRKVEEQRRESEELYFMMDALRERVSLLKKIEIVQNEKLENERSRLFRGRTTTYQVLLFEQDAASSELNRIRAEGELLNLYAKLTLYGKGDLP